MRHCWKTPISLALASLTLFVLALGSESVATAQTRPPVETGPDAAIRADREMRDRQTNITLLEHGKDEGISRQAAAKQMNEDFDRVQTVGFGLLTLFSSANLPDYQRIAADAAEVRMRANRIKNYLVLPPTAKEQKGQNALSDAEKDQLKSSLPALKDLIKSFVANPVFRQSSGTQQVDYRELAKARRDLDDIIDLSGRIRKTAEKMSK
jgi:hypothetical protein